jgi:DNA-binding beta-propeller fold protein YncE
VTGELTEHPSPGCISGYVEGCTNAKALAPGSMAMSPDGKNVYVAGGYAVAVFDRNATTGRLTQLPGTSGCVSETGSGGDCADGKALDGASSVAVSADGESVYVESGPYSNGAVAVFDRNTTTGELTQLPGTAGCVSETGSGGDCADAKALLSPTSVAVSADGKSVYVTSQYNDAVAVFDRNPTTGELTQLPGTAGCVSETGSGGDCVDAKALAVPRSVAVSADGESVYVASAAYSNGAVAVFDRNTTTGELTQLPGTAGCVSETGSGGTCADGKALDPFSVAVSADGKSVYVASYNYGGGAVAVFDRNTTTGELTQLPGTAGCVTEYDSGGTCADGKALAGAYAVAVSADGKNVYVASYSSGMAVFDRNTTTGELTQLAGTAGCVSETGTTQYSGDTCADGKALYSVHSVAVSADGTSVYVASFYGVAVFRRNTTTGTVTQLSGGCVSETGSGADCADGKALDGAFSVAASPDGKNVYVASALANAVAVFARNTTTGELTQLGTYGCVSETGSGGTCTNGKALKYPTSVAVSADGKSVYVASFNSSAVAVFGRNTTNGRLTQLAGTDGCVSETGSGGACSVGRALGDPLSVAVSADGTSVYVGSNSSNAVASFTRNTTTGALTQPAGTAGCVSEDGSGGACADGKALSDPRSVAVSPDGKNVYVTSVDALAVFGRNTTTGELTQLAGTAGCVSETGSSGACINGRALKDPFSVAVSADGKSAYVASHRSDAVAGFARNTTTGKLTPFAGTDACVSETGSGGTCVEGTALNGAFSVAVSPDGASLYVASEFTDGVAEFSRNATTGRFTQLAGTAGCVTETGSGGICANGRALDGARSVVATPDGLSVYAASSASSDAVVGFARQP